MGLPAVIAERVLRVKPRTASAVGLVLTPSGFARSCHPDIKFMNGWTEAEIRSYCQFKDWECDESKFLPPHI